MADEMYLYIWYWNDLHSILNSVTIARNSYFNNKTFIEGEKHFFNHFWETIKKILELTKESTEYF